MAGRPDPQGPHRRGEGRRRRKDRYRRSGGRGKRGWIDEQLDRSLVRLAPGARARLIEHLGEDLGRLRGLLDVLESAFGEGATIDEETIGPLLGEAGDVPPWELTDAIDKGEIADAIGALHRQMDAGARHPLQVMATLHGHVERWLRLDGADAADEKAAAGILGLKGSTFPAKKALSQTRRLGSERIAEAVKLLAKADLDVRGATGLDERMVVEVLVGRVAQLCRRA